MLDTFLPRYQFHEVHQTVVRAAPERAFAALKAVTAEEVLLFRVLMGLRALPRRLRGQRGLGLAAGRPLLEQFLGAGFVLLAEVPAKELVVGVIGQPWNLWGGAFPRIASAEEFLGFNQPGYAKVALNFLLTSDSDQHTRLRTETRIHISDEATRQQFAVYWFVIRRGSAFIRKMWLRAVSRRVEM